MVISRVTPLIEQTAELLKYPVDVPNHVIRHFFDFLKAYLLAPQSAGVRFKYFGIIRPSRNSLYKYLTSLIIRMRRDPDPKLRERFRVFWALRHLIVEDNKRRDFKSRFGTWHHTKNKHDNE